jgi:hypothetical protein
MHLYLPSHTDLIIGWTWIRFVSEKAVGTHIVKYGWPREGTEIWIKGSRRSDEREFKKKVCLGRRISEDFQ